jgi:phosphotriesterase-related protein
MSATHSFVRTVAGDIPPDSLGVTLCHEHLLCDQRAVTFQPPVDPDDAPLADRQVALDFFGWLQLNWASNRDNLVLDDEVLAIEEALRFRRAGGQTLVDCTLPGLGRDPRALLRIAQASGLHIVMGTGYYVAATHPSRVAEMSEDELCRHMLREVCQGDVNSGSGVRAGIIGEIGCSWPLDPAEVRVLRAAGVAQRELGCGLSIHPGRHSAAPRQIVDVLRPSGVDLTRVVIGHIERTVRDLDGLKELLDAGCFVEYDLFGTESTANVPYRSNHVDIPSDAQRIDQISELVTAGYQTQILMSHDVCTKHRTRHYGGVGYDHILRDIVPWMRARGFEEATVRALMVDNPRRALSITKGRDNSCVLD